MAVEPAVARAGAGAAGRLAAGVVGLMLVAAASHAQVRLGDDTDRSAFRSWFTFLADAQFYRPTPDVADCAGLVRHAVREALRAHTPEWHRLAGLPLSPPFSDVRSRPQPRQDGWPLFLVGKQRYAEFADAQTIITLNSRDLGRDVGALRPADLLYFRQEGQRTPDHLMVFVGPSLFERGPQDWIVYHTGPTDGSPGEVRKTRLADLVRHPAARWRPVVQNPAFVGVYRLAWL
jgi:uncharacterized protein YfaT (DUF1175 family)